MFTSRTLALLALVGLGACNSVGTGRTVSGQLVPGVYPVSNATVLAYSTSGKVYGTHLRADGSFRLHVAAGATYRLLIANPTPSGTYRAVTRITWPSQGGRTQWAHIGAGGRISLGSIRPLGSGAQSAGLSTASVPADDGDTGGDNDNNDDDGNNNDADDSAVCDGQHGDAVDAQVFGGQQATDSQSDLAEGNEVIGDDGAAGELEADQQLDNQCGG